MKAGEPLCKPFLCGIGYYTINAFTCQEDSGKKFDLSVFFYNFVSLRFFLRLPGRGESTDKNRENTGKYFQYGKI